jgi:hypothetical protein
MSQEEDAVFVVYMSYRIEWNHRSATKSNQTGGIYVEPAGQDGHTNLRTGVVVDERGRRR